MALDLDLIEDPDLREEIIALGLTLPHPESVLSPAIGDYDEQFYYKLLAMEAYTYEQSSRPAELFMGVPTGQAGVTEYRPYWQTYNTALLGYVNHPPVSKQKLKDLVMGLYGFLSLHVTRNAGSPDTLLRSNARTIFNLNGYVATVMGYPLNHFDDYIPGDPMAMPTPTESQAPRLQADAAFVETAWERDEQKLDDLIAEYAEVVSDVIMAAVFSNPTPPAGSLTPVEAWDTIFMDLNWKWFNEHFNGALTIPPRPEEPSPSEPEPTD